MFSNTATVGTLNSTPIAWPVGRLGTRLSVGLSFCSPTWPRTGDETRQLPQSPCPARVSAAAGYVLNCRHVSSTIASVASVPNRVPCISFSNPVSRLFPVGLCPAVYHVSHWRFPQRRFWALFLMAVRMTSSLSVTVSSNLVWKDRRGYILSLKSALTVALIYSWPAPTCSD